ncbi:hypothetical protein DFH09DRAFT_1146621 [Mycena vulgaris]|nr:hypothetical protein DFH09DRAFT_1146621 [Mycena vulgaris]
MVAESASEDDESASAGDEEDDAESTGDEAGSAADEAPNAEEFVQELPQMIRRAANGSKDVANDAASDIEASDSDRSHELDDMAPSKSKSKAKATQDLFESEEEEDEAPPPKRSIWHHARPPPRTVKGDDDVAMDEAIADALVSIPRLTHSRRSSTGSGWSSGQDLTIPDSEPDSDAESESEMPVPPPAKPQKLSVRQKKADLEKPQVRPAPGAARNGVAAVEDPDRPEASWDVTTRLVLPAPNRDIGLTAQHAEVQLVLRGTIEDVRIHLFFAEAYPVMPSRVGWIRPVMITRASVHPSTIHVLHRLQTDPKFAAILASIPLDRLNIQRGDTKRCAVTIVMVMYKLTDMSPAQVKARVEELLQDHRYIFPVDAKTGQMDLSQPFHHAAIKFILKDQMLSSSVFKNRNYDRFPARNLKKPEAREVADPMVALSATAVYASLLELRMTGERQPMAFTEDAFEDIYRVHIKTLEDTRASAPLPMHRVLHGLFKDVTSTTKAVQTAAGSSATLISLVDVPDSD